MQAVVKERPVEPTVVGTSHLPVQAHVVSAVGSQSETIRPPVQIRHRDPGSSPVIGPVDLAKRPGVGPGTGLGVHQQSRDIVISHLGYRGPDRSGVVADPQAMASGANVQVLAIRGDSQSQEAGFDAPLSNWQWAPTFAIGRKEQADSSQSQIQLPGAVLGQSVSRAPWKVGGLPGFVWGRSIIQPIIRTCPPPAPKRVPMEGEDGLVCQPLVISDPGFAIIVRAPQPRWVIGAGVEHARLSGIGSYRQGEGVARQALTEGLPTCYLAG